MEIDPTKNLNQLAGGNPGQKQGAGDGSAFRAALEKAQGGSGASLPEASEGVAASRGTAELVGMLRHQAVQEDQGVQQGGRMQQALDLVTGLSADFAQGRTPQAAELQSADATLARLEQQAGPEERESLRDARTAVNFYLGRAERESG